MGLNSKLISNASKYRNNWCIRLGIFGNQCHGRSYLAVANYKSTATSSIDSVIYEWDST